MDLCNKEERAPLVGYQSKTYYRILKAEGVESFIRKRQRMFLRNLRNWQKSKIFSMVNETFQNPREHIIVAIRNAY
jgi:hypothetical protein